LIRGIGKKDLRIHKNTEGGRGERTTQVIVKKPGRKRTDGENGRTICKKKRAYYKDPFMIPTVEGPTPQKEGGKKDGGTLFIGLLRGRNRNGGGGRIQIMEFRVRLSPFGHEQKKLEFLRSCSWGQWDLGKVDYRRRRVWGKSKEETNKE